MQKPLVVDKAAELIKNTVINFTKHHNQIQRKFGNSNIISLVHYAIDHDAFRELEEQLVANKGWLDVDIVTNEVYFVGQNWERWLIKVPTDSLTGLVGSVICYPNLESIAQDLTGALEN